MSPKHSEGAAKSGKKYYDNDELHCEGWQLWKSTPWRLPMEEYGTISNLNASSTLTWGPRPSLSCSSYFWCTGEEDGAYLDIDPFVIVIINISYRLMYNIAIAINQKNGKRLVCYTRYCPRPPGNFAAVASVH